MKTEIVGWLNKPTSDNRMIVHLYNTFPLTVPILGLDRSTSLDVAANITVYEDQIIAEYPTSWYNSRSYQLEDVGDLCLGLETLTGEIGLDILKISGRIGYLFQYKGISLWK